MEGIVGFWAHLVDTIVLGVAFFLAAITVLAAIAVAAFFGSKHRGEGEPEVRAERKTRRTTRDDESP